MNYFVDLFSPETYEAFSRSSRDVSGFRMTQRKAATHINVGDKFVCYMTKLSRWVGILEVVSPAYEDASPIFYEETDPFVVRFRVKPIVWLPKEKAVPIKEDSVWNVLTFTRGADKTSSAWTGRLRSSLGRLEHKDGTFLEQLLTAQATNSITYPVEESDYRKFLTLPVRRHDKIVGVSIPQDRDAEDEPPTNTQVDVRESIRMQALLASIGEKMGMRIWIPRSDRAAVCAEWHRDHAAVLDVLPLNYDEITLKTIEQIDVLWLKGRAIVRAFEVEHTTSIYSGILRMADLLALQPNMDIKLHIVAPPERRDKVFRELRRPVFSLLERGPLYESCKYLSYESIRELAQLPHLKHVSDSILDEYAEEAE